MIWHIWWLAIFATLGILVTVILRAADDETEYIIPAAEVEQIEKMRYRTLAEALNKPAENTGTGEIHAKEVNDDN